MKRRDFTLSLLSSPLLLSGLAQRATRPPRRKPNRQPPPSSMRRFLWTRSFRSAAATSGQFRRTSRRDSAKWKRSRRCAGSSRRVRLRWDMSIWTPTMPPATSASTRRPFRTAMAVKQAQRPEGGWNYIHDFRGEGSLKHWYDTIGATAGGWRSFSTTTAMPRSTTPGPPSRRSSCCGCTWKSRTSAS